MVDLIEQIKHRARRLHRQAAAGDPAALAFLQRTATFSVSERGEEPANAGADVQRRHCLAAIALRLGFRGWPHARAMLSGEPTPDRGTIMHKDSGGAFWNIWSASYEEASVIRAEHGGFLLAFRRHFMVVDDHYVRWLGLSPEDPDWAPIGRDWAKTTLAAEARSAWSRLTLTAIDARLGLSALR